MVSSARPRSSGTQTTKELVPLFLHLQKIGLDPFITWANSPKPWVM